MPETLGFHLMYSFCPVGSSPLWMHGHILFMGKAAADNVVTPWFYDFVHVPFGMERAMSFLRNDFPHPQHHTIGFHR